ncbi:MAG: hypothetical protein HZB91_07330 [Elusimicrobia bacterium]|nr:hypothetical protein [Elusimicrobiota bacterium]
MPLPWPKKWALLVWWLAFVLVGVPAGVSLWVRFGLGMDIDMLATALRALIPCAALLPVAAGFGWAAASVRRLFSRELPFAAIPILKHIVLPAGLGLGWAVIILPWAVLHGLAVVVKLPELRGLERYELFKDDRLEDKNPVFEPDLVDSRMFEGYQVNVSPAVIALSIGKEKPGFDRGFSRLYPSYSAAAAALSTKGQRLLPSVNAMDGKAKQFDDGLLAALHLAAARGPAAGPASDIGAFLDALLDRLEPGGKAYAWVWAGLKVGGRLAPSRAANVPGDGQRYIEDFGQELGSKPFGFYGWSPELGQAYILLRFFQKELDSRDPRAVEIAGLLAREPGLMARYVRLLDWLGRLETGASRAPSFADAAGVQGGGAAVPQSTKSLLPCPRSKEDLLFGKLFGAGLPPGADLMLELVKAIRSGQLDLKPGAKAGWYEYQAYALETFLLPERGAENGKLMLDKEYKKRMLKAFAAILTKRRETHALMGMFAMGSLAEDEGGRPRTPLPPRLRVEPNPTYYLRMARSYAFLETFLKATLPGPGLDGLRGLKESGQRRMALGKELAWMKELFYGLHLVSCEDIGMRPLLLKDELESPARDRRTAEDWLARWHEDEDLSADTRVIVPVAHDLEREVTRFWATMGVRGAMLHSYYARPPKWRLPPSGGKSPGWEDASTTGASWVILVDEFAEIESRRTQTPSREEYRRIADREGTKEGIAAALAGPAQ